MLEPVKGYHSVNFDNDFYRNYFASMLLPRSLAATIISAVSGVSLFLILRVITQVDQREIFRFFCYTTIRCFYGDIFRKFNAHLIFFCNSVIRHCINYSTIKIDHRNKQFSVLCRVFVSLRPRCIINPIVRTWRCPFSLEFTTLQLWSSAQDSELPPTSGSFRSPALTSWEENRDGFSSLALAQSEPATLPFTGIGSLL